MNHKQGVHSRAGTVFHMFAGVAVEQVQKADINTRSITKYTNYAPPDRMMFSMYSLVKKEGNSVFVQKHVQQHHELPGQQESIRATSDLLCDVLLTDLYLHDASVKIWPFLHRNLKRSPKAIVLR
jgi:hypothetical protein